jgi:N-methylhydantoinase B
MVLGDLKALVGGANTGGMRMAELIDRVGDGPLAAAVDFLIDYSERRTRLIVSQLPPGTYSGEGVIDDDGVEHDRSLTVRVNITTDADGTFVVDFSGTDRQAAGAVNASYSQATSAAVYGSRLIVDDPDIPINEGVFTALDLVLPQGTLVNPNWPAAVNGRGITMMAMIEAMCEALSKQQPHRAVAVSPMNHVMSVSINDSNGGYRVFIDNDYGGTGARASKDGVDATGSAFLAGRTFTVSVEGVEQEHAVMYDRFRLRPDSGGAGRSRGGLGTERTVRFLQTGLASMRADKSKFPAKGFAGGGDGAPSGWVFNLGRTDERRLNSKETNVPMRPGDTLSMLTAGGGGYGNPRDRDRDQVRTDVREGKVSPEAAGRDYGLDD